MPLLLTHFMGKSAMLLLYPTYPKNDVFLYFHAETHFQPVLSLTHLKSVLPSGPIKIKNV